MDISRKYLFFPDKEGNEQTGYAPDAKLRLRIRYDKTCEDLATTPPSE
jgi:hypothetical protein